MKRLVIICGSNHSGTSAVAELFHKAGSHLGKCDNKITEATKYMKYENIAFKNWCTMKIWGKGISDEDDLKHDQLLCKIIDGLYIPDSKPVVLKYPKAALCLHLIPKQLVRDYHITVIYVLRNPYQIIQSTLKRITTGQIGQDILLDLSGIYDAIANSYLKVVPIMIEKMDDVRYCRDLLNMFGFFYERDRDVPTIDISRMNSFSEAWFNGNIRSEDIRR